eukprot:7376901-Prymnesium_polylepis.1
MAGAGRPHNWRAGRRAWGHMASWPHGATGSAEARRTQTISVDVGKRIGLMLERLWMLNFGCMVHGYASR